MAGTLYWRPRFSLRATDRGVPWAVFLACVGCATASYFLSVAPLYWETLLRPPLEDLVLPPPGAAVSASTPPPESPGLVPGLVFFVPWLVFVAAACVAWLALLGIPTCRGPRHAI